MYGVGQDAAPRLRVAEREHVPVARDQAERIEFALRAGLTKGGSVGASVALVVGVVFAIAVIVVASVTAGLPCLSLKSSFS